MANTEEKLNLVYFLNGKTYINITNACTNSCAFCLRNDKDDVKGAYMWHKGAKVTADDVIAQIEEKNIEILNRTIMQLKIKLDNQRKAAGAQQAEM